jgi:hypothetical protein
MEDLTATYVKIVVLETVIVILLWAFGRVYA